jgi:tetratricopeptide (TPR) repeat protein
MQKFLAKLSRFIKGRFVRESPPSQLPPPDFRSDLDNFQPNNYKDWCRQGIALFELGRFEEALASYEQALQLQPDEYIIWFNQGNALWKLGRLKEALASYDQALQLQPDFHLAWNGRGNALTDLGRFEEALASYDQAVQLQPDSDMVWNGRGNALKNLGRFEEALASYDQALQLQPDLHYAWYGRGNVLSDLGRFEEALASFNQALKLKPDFHYAWNGRGNVLSDLGRFEEALASFNQALKLKPDFHDAWNGRGTALGNLGRLEEALASFNQALKLKPDDHKAWVNRGMAAAESLGYEPFWQQQFAACFRSEASKAPQRLIPALETIDRERCLAQFQASLSASKALLLETLDHLDAPNLIALIQQPLSPKLSQFIRQSSPRKLIELIQQPLREAVVAKLEQDSPNHPSRLNPELRKRGYEGQLASYQAELDKAIRRDTHPEGWGYLHHQIGRAHYFRGWKDAYPSSFWRKAEMSYKTALQTLKPPPPEFEELRLDVLRDLIRVLLDLGETKQEQAHELQRQGTDLLRRILADPKRTERQKREIALKSAVFNQLSVDLTLQSGDRSGALTLAETGKNTCLRWMLRTGEIPTLDYAQFQRLFTPTTAAIYWHLSPRALTTFVILPNEPAPIVVENTGINLESLTETLESHDPHPASLQQILAWEKWLSKWNQRYQDYGSSKLKKDTTAIEQGDKTPHPWRTRMEESLEHLKQILNISGIEQHLQNHPINTLILIPHRNLHRFPLHAFFDNYTCTYLPSAYLGLQQQAKPQLKALNSLLVVENPKSTPDVQSKAKILPDLPFAEVEAALIRQLFSEVTPIENPDTTYDQLL